MQIVSAFLKESEKRLVLYNSILQSTLERYGKTAFDVTLLVLEDDGAVLTSSLAAASLALADAKVEMRDLIAGATVHLKQCGSPNPVLLLDCDRAEEQAMAALQSPKEQSAVLHLGMLCLLHSVGPLPPEPFEQMVLLGKVQRRAEKKRARSFNDLGLEDGAYAFEDTVVDDGYG
eukprot:Skav202284  [mRNA]  locus=scaffold3044:317152:319429:- [translate_table: standard]